MIPESGSIDVHVVTHAAVGHGVGLPRFNRGFTARRRIGVPGRPRRAGARPRLLGLTRSSLDLISAALVFLLVVVLVAWSAAVTRARRRDRGLALLNYYFVPPLYTFNITSASNVFALVVLNV